MTSPAKLTSAQHFSTSVYLCLLCQQWRRRVVYKAHSSHIAQTVSSNSSNSIATNYFSSNCFGIEERQIIFLHGRYKFNLDFWWKNVNYRENVYQLWTNIFLWIGIWLTDPTCKLNIIIVSLHKLPANVLTNEFVQCMYFQWHRKTLSNCSEQVVWIPKSHIEKWRQTLHCLTATFCFNSFQTEVRICVICSPAFCQLFPPFYKVITKQTFAWAVSKCGLNCGIYER